VDLDEYMKESNWEYTHPEAVYTCRIERTHLDAGEDVYVRRLYATVVGTLPPGAVETEGRWYHYAPSVGTSHQHTPACLRALGLTWPCTVEDVKRAYWALAWVAHPDTTGSHEAFVVLQAFYKAALQLVGG
jgi:hypothetical protein